MKKTIYRIMILAVAYCVTAASVVSCYSEEELTPTLLTDDLLFDFPQGNSESDRILQKVQEEYGCYPVYRGITPNLLNRTWVNLYPNMTIVADEIADGELAFYTDFLTGHFLDWFDAEAFGKYLPRYFFMVKNMHREENDIAKAHMPVKTDGVDFWAISFETRFLSNPVQSELRPLRLILIYELILKALNDGFIEIPINFTDGVDYRTPIINDVSNPHSANHYQTRGFVKYVQPSFSSESIAALDLIASNNEDFLMYIRKILYTAPEAFVAENGTYDLVMKRYQIVLDCFNNYGIDLGGIAEGPKNE